MGETYNIASFSISGKHHQVLVVLTFLVLEETLSRLTEHWKVILGPLLVLVVLFARGGIAGAIDACRRQKMTPAQLLAKLVLLPKQGFAAATDQWQQWKSPLRCAVGEAAGRWKSYKIALGRLLVTLLHGVAAAINRWRRR